VSASATAAAPGGGAPAAGWFGTREGDTILVIEHDVRAGRREDYERWMREVWWASARKVAAGNPRVREVLAERRRFVPTDRSDDSTYTYLFVYRSFPDLGAKRSGVAAMLELAGMPDAEIERQMAAFTRLAYRARVFAMVQREYPGGGGQ